MLVSATFAPLCPHVLLGREDFFRYFKSVNFEQEKEKIHLEGATDWEASARAAQANVKKMGAQAEAHVKAQLEATVAAAT